jgi:hypothetical protein
MLAKRLAAIYIELAQDDFYVRFYGGLRNIQLSGDLASGVTPANMSGNLFLARGELIPTLSCPGLSGLLLGGLVDELRGYLLR